MNFSERLYYRLLPFCVSGAMVAAVMGCPGTTASAVEAKAYNDFMQRTQQLRVTDPAKAATDIRQFIDGGTLTPAQIASLYNYLANVQAVDLKDAAAAIATLDEGLQKVSGATREPVFYTKVHTLTIAKRATEAETLLKAEWPQMIKSGFAYKLLPDYVSVLQQQGKSDEALQLTRQMLIGQIELVSRTPATFELLVNQLLTAGREDEALGWAKLYFMVSPYDEKAMQSAMQLLVRAWSAKYMAPAKVQAMVAAQQNPAGPSPLREVALPSMDQAVLRQRLETAPQPTESILLLILLNDYQPAMAQARRMMLDQPQSNAGVLEVCRIFKAYDLNVKRANAFLEYYKSGEGDNPISEFLRETQKPEAK